MKIKPLERAFQRQHTKRSKTDLLVIHHGASAISFKAEDYHDWHIARGFYGVGYNFVIEWDGTIKQGRPIWAVGAHSKPVNTTSIGVCLVGNFQHHRPSHDQYKAFAWLCNNVITKEYSNLKIVGHFDTDATACPGIQFSFKHMSDYIKEGVEQVEKWKTDLMQKAHDLELIDLAHGHKPDETATKWFVLAIGINILKKLGGK